MKVYGDCEKAKRFDAVSKAINPFDLNRLHMPLRGLKSPYSKKGYWGFRGKYISKFVEKLI